MHQKETAPTTDAANTIIPDGYKDKDFYGTINPLHLYKNYWNLVPFMPGYKMAHTALFFAVADSLNSNRWRPTSIPYDYLLNKCGCCKQTYLDARQWLVNHDVLTVIAGKSAYQMAVFDVGKAVYKRTGSSPPEQPQEQTAPLAPSQPHLKTGNKKPKTEKPKTYTAEFEEFWNVYGKRVDKVEAFKEWVKLTAEELETIKAHAPRYVQATPDPTYRKAPKNYLKGKAFNNDIPTTRSNKNQLVIKHDENAPFIQF